MSYQVYKIIHIVGIVLFFSLYAVAAYRGQAKKSEKIITGVLLVIILVAGMGLVARLGIPHGQPWPMWLKAKLGIWIVLGSLSHLVLKRFPGFAVKFFWIAVGLLTLASYLANYKVG